MKPKKYHFIPEHQLNTSENDDAGYTVNINSNGTLYFSPFVVKVYGLKDKIIRLYADTEKKSIAWTEIKGGDLSVLKNVRQMKVNPQNENIVIMVTKILKQLGVTKDMLPMKKVPVTTYIDSFIQEELHVLDLRNYVKGKTKEE